MPAARNLALQYALVEVAGVECKLERAGAEDGPLSYADLERLRELVGDAGLRELGNAAIAVSRRELMPAEKKR